MSIETKSAQALDDQTPVVTDHEHTSEQHDAAIAECLAALRPDPSEHCLIWR